MNVTEKTVQTEAPAPPAGVVLKEGELLKIVEEIVVEARPGVQAHGGDVEIVSVIGTEVKLRLSGACGACMYSAGTLAAFARLLKRKAPPGTKLVMLR